MDALNELTALPPARGRESLADGVYNALRDGITNGSLSAGFRLREVALAKHFGVSTTPVREALRRLEREGLVDLSLHRGATVAKLRFERWAELNEVRDILATQAIRKAALAPERDFSRVEAILARTEAYLNESETARFTQLDIDFHRALTDLSGNHELAELTELLHRRIQGLRIRHDALLPNQHAVSHAEHVAIVAAVRARDAERAVQLLRQHNATIVNAMQRILNETAHEDQTNRLG